jgi:hypothetical protein
MLSMARCHFKYERTSEGPQVFEKPPQMAEAKMVKQRKEAEKETSKTKFKTRAARLFSPGS